MQILRAKFVGSIALPLIENGFVTLNAGRIVDVGRFNAAAFASRDVQDLGEVVLLPGLVNAHTHLELSHVKRDPARPASFGTWALSIVRSLATPPTDEAIRAATLAGAAESLSFGVTTVGDITRSPAITRSGSIDSPIQLRSFGEVRAMGRRRNKLEAQLDAAIDPRDGSPLDLGISPHAPYSVEPGGYRSCVRLASDLGLPLTTHLAESLDEIEFMNHHTGPLRELWEAIGAWDDHVPRFEGSPVEFAKSVGLLDAAALLAHVNYASDSDLEPLSHGNASIVWCPRTHEYFGHPPHRWKEMLARGINVCIGTDSRATSPDLNLVDDLRLVHRESPEVPVETLWEMATTRAARGLWRRDVGAIARGMRADLVAFPVQTNDPLREILETQVAPATTFVSGERIVPPSTFPRSS